MQIGGKYYAESGQKGVVSSTRPERIPPSLAELVTQNDAMTSDINDKLKEHVNKYGKETKVT